MKRRHAIIAALGAAATARAFGADEFPSRPITLIVTAPPGGGLDMIGRAVAEEMGKVLKQTVVVDNRPGGAGILGTNATAKAQPDGYTIGLVLNAAVLNNLFLYAKMPYDPRRDLAFISEVCSGQTVMVVNAGVAAATPLEMLAWMKANPARASYGSWGPGSYAHVVGHHLATSRGVPMVHVPYKGEAPMVQDLVGGQIAWAVASLQSALPHIEAGRLRALALSGERRAEALPKVPTFAEAGLADSELIATGSVFLMAPAAVPATVLDKLERAAVTAVATPAVRSRLQQISFVPLGTGARKARESYDAMYPVQERLFKSLNIRLD